MDFGARILSGVKKSLVLLRKCLIMTIFLILVFRTNSLSAASNSNFKEYPSLSRNSNFGDNLDQVGKLQFVSSHLRARNIQIRIHKVKRGENYWIIARQYGIDIDTIVGANPQLESLTASINQEIYVLNKKGLLHLVKKGDTIFSLSKVYGVSPESILNENYIFQQDFIPGTILFIPRAHPIKMAPKVAEYYQTRDLFYSPIMGGRITSTFGYRTDPMGGGTRDFHNGIDIAARIGTPIYASASGRVTFAGYRGGYGKAIQIVHKNGYSTFYAHCSVILVNSGQQVRRGQIIGRVGNTGRATGPHVHFSIFLYGRALNPLKFL